MPKASKNIKKKSQCPLLYASSNNLSKWQEMRELHSPSGGSVGLEITAGQRTMSGLTGDLTGQTLALTIKLTSHIRSY